MAERVHILTDLDQEVWHDQFQLSSRDGLRLDGATDWSITKRTLKGGVSDGIDVVRVDNGALSVEILPTRGMSLWRGTYRDMDLGWKSPVRRPVHPSLVNQLDHQGLGWLAGFNEWVCRCGLSSLGPPGIDVVDRAGSRIETQMSLHGRIANTPCHHVSVEVEDDGPGTLSIHGTIDEAWLYGPKLQLKSTLQTAAGSNSLNIIDEVTNRSDEPGELQFLYHTNLGPPLLEQGSNMLIAAREVAPYDEHSASSIDNWCRFTAPTPGYVQECYYVDPIADENGNSTALLHNRKGNKGIALTFSTSELPCFTLWKNLQGEGDGYVTGLEPGTCFPNLKSFERERGRVISLPPGNSYRTTLRVHVLDSESQVMKVSESIRCRQNAKPTLHRQLHSNYAPADGIKP